MKLSELKVIVPVSKPRDPNYRTLKAKANASGAHRDKKAEEKRGKFKYGQRPGMHESLGDEE